MDPTKYGPANHKFQILLSATLLPYRHVVSKYTVLYQYFHYTLPNLLLFKIFFYQKQSCSYYSIYHTLYVLYSAQYL